MTRADKVHIVKMPITWILVADARRAKIYTRNKVEKLVPASGSMRHKFEEIVTHEPVQVPDQEWEAESDESYDVGRNSTGMVFESAGSARHMAEPHLKVQEELREHFASLVAKQLNKARIQRRFDNLVLIAPAKMLGEIKKHLDARTLKRVKAEMSKDLTQFSVQELANHLSHIA